MQKIKIAESLMVVTHRYNLINKKIERIKNKTKPIIKLGF